ncbi:hypothetical protein ScPMuIL_011146 [Solemya velum]
MAERPEDLNLPNTVITRIIKDAIPDGVNVSKEARLAISKAASVFVLYATSCSNNFAMRGKRKTISAQDVISAMEDMEFDHFIQPLQQCLDTYRRDQLDKKEATEKKKKAKEQESSVVIDLDTNGDSNDDNAEDVEPEADEDYNPEEEVEEEEDEEGEEMDSAKGDDAEVVEISDESADT